MILKLGSVGEEVKTLQEFLEIAADGIFGPMTEQAVKDWQHSNKLTVDGIVGPITWNAMGIATTDIYENPDHDVEFDEIIVSLPKGEYMKGPHKKRWLFLHHTGGWNNPTKTVTHWAKDSRGAIATEFVLGGQSIRGDNNKYDGTLVKCMPDGAYGWHLGTGNNFLHWESIGVETNSFGQLTKGGYTKRFKNGQKVWMDGDPSKYYNYVGIEAHPDQVCILPEKFRGFKAFHRYSDKQIAGLAELCRDVRDRDGIDVTKGLPDLIRKMGAYKAFDFCDVAYVKANPGLYCHTNVLRGKIDMYPQPELVDMLLNL